MNPTTAPAARRGVEAQAIAVLAMGHDLAPSCEGTAPFLSPLGLKPESNSIKFFFSILFAVTNNYVCGNKVIKISPYHKHLDGLFNAA